MSAPFIMVAVGMAFIIGFAIPTLQPFICLHEWGKWDEVRGLELTIHDEFGGRKTKKYRRFERTCAKCGAVSLKKKRTN